MCGKILLIIMYVWGCDFLSLMLNVCYSDYGNLKLMKESKFISLKFIKGLSWKMTKLINGQTHRVYEAFVLCFLYNMLKIQWNCIVDRLCFWLLHSVKWSGCYHYQVLMLFTMGLQFHHQHRNQLKDHAQRSRYHCVMAISKCRAVLMLRAALNSSVVSGVI